MASSSKSRAPSPLKIRTQAVRRLVNDLKYCKTEEKNQEARIEKMRLEGRDEADIKKQIEVLKDTQQMEPVIQDQIMDAFNNLRNEFEKTTETDAAVLDDAKELLDGNTLEFTLQNPIPTTQ